MMRHRPLEPLLLFLSQLFVRVSSEVLSPLPSSLSSQDPVPVDLAVPPVPLHLGLLGDIELSDSFAWVERANEQQ
jgi:hypothetical protein